MEILSKLFGSSGRVKILRLFLLNSDTIFDVPAIVKRSKVTPLDAKRELKLLLDIDLVRPKTKMVGDDTEGAERRIVKGWQVNSLFPLVPPLSQLLTNTVPFKKEEVISRLKHVGRLKLVVTAGVFLQRDDSRTDLLVVGDDIRRSHLERAVRGMEAEIGRELVYGVFETTDFMYRLNVYDKFIRDILDYPHEKILNRLSLDNLA